MGYVTNNLMPGEHILHTAGIHGFVFVRALLLGAVACVLFNVDVLFDVQDKHDIALAAAAFFAFFAVISLLRAAILKVSTELAITNRRLIVKLGLFGSRTMELSHGKVEGVAVQQGVLGRLFGFGTVVVSGAGGGRIAVGRVRGPHDFRRRASGAAGDAGMAPAQPASP